MSSEKDRERRNEHLRLVYQERFAELKRIKGVYENLLVVLTTAVAGGLFYFVQSRGPAAPPLFSHLSVAILAGVALTVLFAISGLLTWSLVTGYVRNKYTIARIENEWGFRKAIVGQRHLPPDHNPVRGADWWWRTLLLTYQGALWLMCLGLLYL